MTTIINLYGGPGTGKSTTAALMFATLKQRGVNAELVQEVAKRWAWQGRPITPLDQFQIFGEQLARESDLLGKCDVVVTDGPLLLGEFFSTWFEQHAIATALKHAREVYDDELRAAKHEQWHVFLHRSKPYNPKGRYQTEAEARRMDGKQLLLVSQTYRVWHELDTARDDIAEFLTGFDREVKIGDVWK